MDDAAALDTEALRHIYKASQLVAPHSAIIEVERRMPPEVLDALVDAGAFKLALPRDLGGSAAGLPTVLAAIEAIARADASAGWTVMIGITSSLMCGWLDDESNLEIFGPDDALASGVFAPMGEAHAVAHGFRVSGQWPYASGCEHAQHRMVGALVKSDSGMPEMRCFVFKAEQTTIVDTWEVSGLRGTGSHDLLIEGAFVPTNRSFSLIDDPRRPIAPLLNVPVFGVLAAGIAAVSLGIAHSSIGALSMLASGKGAVPGRRGLGHRELVQVAVARAEAKRAAARAWLFETAQTAMMTAEDELPTPIAMRARLRNAACHAVRECADAVDLMYEAGGGASVYDRNPLQRHFRDVHVVTQHMMVAPAVQSVVGRVLLGIEADTSQL